MKVNLEKLKNAETWAEVKQKTTEIVQKTSETGKKVATDVVANVQQSARNLSEKSQSEAYQKRLKKYNPLFWEQFRSETFTLPNMIVIVDDAVRKGIDVCEGAIGWLGNQNGMEVFYLYDEVVNEVGLKFIPAATCDTVYYVDKFDRSRFIQTESIFSKAHEERLAELKQIAYSLGAKRCSIEISEASMEVESEKSSYEASGKGFPAGAKAAVSVEQSSSYKTGIQRSGKILAEFEGSSDACEPQLKWFKHDDTIKRLIEMRCSSRNAIKSETLILEGSASATMSNKTAIAIDGAIGKLGIKAKGNMEKQAIKENQSKLIFVVEF